AEKVPAFQVVVVPPAVRGRSPKDDEAKALDPIATDAHRGASLGHEAVAGVEKALAVCATEKCAVATRVGLYMHLGEALANERKDADAEATFAVALAGDPSVALDPHAGHKSRKSFDAAKRRHKLTVAHDELTVSGRLAPDIIAKGIASTDPLLALCYADALR